MIAASCRSAPVADGATLEVTAAQRGVGETLGEIAKLRSDIDQAARFKQLLEEPQSPALDWMAEGAGELIALGLQRRHELLQGSAREESQLVKASLAADVSPALREFLEETRE